MALVTSSSWLARNHPLSTRDVAIPVFGSLLAPISCSRLDLVSIRSSSFRPSRCTAGRESSIGGNSITEWGQHGQGARSRRDRCRPVRGIKISRESTVDRKEEEDEDEDDDTELCSVECVREFKSRSEFDEVLQFAQEQNALVVVDFFKTACGSCRYIEKGFTKLCKGAGNTDVSVIFLKHNVVPLFHFYKDGKLVESFPTREKTTILEAICKHTGLKLEDFSIPRGN